MNNGNDCPYNVGDKVEKDGICGTVLVKEQLGGIWYLKVQLDTGGEVTWKCDKVQPCSH